jgi:hypothetical protein
LVVLYVVVFVVSCSYVHNRPIPPLPSEVSKKSVFDIPPPEAKPPFAGSSENNSVKKRQTRRITPSNDGNRGGHNSRKK